MALNSTPAASSVAARVSSLAGEPTPDRDELRGVLGRFATGITVLTASSGVPRGMTANAFASVSLEPPLVLVCVHREAAIHRAVMDSESFAVSVLAAHQEHLARYFASHTRPRGEREFDAVSWTPGPSTGAPILDGALAWLECRIAGAYDGGDHSIFLGSVLGTGRGPARGALLFFRSGYHRLEDGQLPS